jgi:hypothetical protein
MRNPRIRSIVISLVIILISIYNFYRSGKSENIKAIQIISLIICGMAIGIFLMNLVGWIRRRKN